MPDAAQIGVGGALCLAVLHTVFYWWTKMQASKRRTDPPGKRSIPPLAVAKLDDLHAILARRDDTDTPILFRLLERQATAAEETAKCLKNQTALLEKLTKKDTP